MSDILQNSLNLSSSTQQTGDEQYRHRRSAIMEAMNENILRLLKRLDDSVKVGNQQEQLLADKVKQSETIIAAIVKTQERCQLGSVDSHLQGREEEDDQSIYFQNRHIPEQDKYRAATFLEVFGVLVWDLLKAYRQDDYKRLTALFATADFTKYPETKEYLNSFPASPAELADLAQGYLKEIESGSAISLAQHTESFRSYSANMIKYIMLATANEQNLADLKNLLQEGDHTWKSAHQAVEFIILDHVISNCELKKTLDDRECFLLEKGKLVIRPQGDEFVGHVQALPTQIPK